MPNQTPIPVSDIASTEAPPAPSHFEQHVGWLCDADKRSTEPTIRALANIAKPRHFADAYASQRVTP